MMENVLVILSCGTDNPNRSTRALHLTTMAHKTGKKPTLFLLDEAVSIARKGVADNLRAATGDIADDHISYLQEYAVPILVCTPCAEARKISKNDLINGAHFATAKDLIEMSCNSAVISL